MVTGLYSSQPACLIKRNRFLTAAAFFLLLLLSALFVFPVDHRIGVWIFTLKKNVHQYIGPSGPRMHRHFHHLIYAYIYKCEMHTWSSHLIDISNLCQQITISKTNKCNTLFVIFAVFFCWVWFVFSFSTREFYFICIVSVRFFLCVCVSVSVQYITIRIQ